MSEYLKNVFKRRVPQSAPLPASNQVANSAGGYVWAVDNWKRLDRFLILGSESGSYYATERALTVENANVLMNCIKEDGVRVVDRAVEISNAGRAPKNDPAIFALAMAVTFGNDETRKAVSDALPKICRIGTHLFHFAEYVNSMRGWGRGLRKGIAQWYNGQPEIDLQYQLLKYQQRNGWGHRDLLRLAHPMPDSESRKALYHWVTQGWDSAGEEPHPDKALQQIWAFERAKNSQSVLEIVNLIQSYSLPREAVPTQFLGTAEVWDALLEDMPLTAMIRNLANMTRAGLLVPGSAPARKIVEILKDTDRIHRARVHPLTLLSAQKVYASGRGERSANAWEPVPDIVFALQEAFYLAFDNVDSTGKRWMLALDVSGSMGSGKLGGMSITPRVGSGALAMVTLAKEECVITGFSHKLIPLPIHKGQRLDDVLATIDGIPFGATDCALPMLYAMEQRLPIDCFVVYTDSETWFGKVHPAAALKRYRAAMGIDAKLIVVGMVANNFSIADPNDRGMLDVIGFDTATPQLINDFALGNI